MATAELTWKERGERRRAIADSVRRGTPPGQAARTFGVSLESVRRACIEYGVQAKIGRERRKAS